MKKIIMPLLKNIIFFSTHRGVYNLVVPPVSNPPPPPPPQTKSLSLWCISIEGFSIWCLGLKVAPEAANKEIIFFISTDRSIKIVNFIIAPEQLTYVHCK